MCQYWWHLECNEIWHAIWKKPLYPLCIVLSDLQLLCSGFCSQPPLRKMLPHGHPGSLNLQNQGFSVVFVRFTCCFWQWWPPEIFHPASPASWPPSPLAGLPYMCSPLILVHGNRAPWGLFLSPLHAVLVLSVTHVPRSSLGLYMNFWVPACSFSLLLFSFLKSEPLNLEPFSPQGTCSNALETFLLTTTWVGGALLAS